MVIERYIMADQPFGTQLMCTVRGNLEGFFSGAATPSRQTLYRQLASMVDDLELGIWRPTALPFALAMLFAPPPLPAPAPAPVAPTGPLVPGCQTLQ